MVCSSDCEIQDKWTKKSQRRGEFSKKADDRKRGGAGESPLGGDSRKTSKLRLLKSQDWVRSRGTG